MDRPDGATDDPVGQTARRTPTARRADASYGGAVSIGGGAAAPADRLAAALSQPAVCRHLVPITRDRRALVAVFDTRTRRLARDADGDTRRPSPHRATAICDLFDQVEELHGAT